MVQQMVHLFVEYLQVAVEEELIQHHVVEVPRDLVELVAVEMVGVDQHLLFLMLELLILAAEEEETLVIQLVLLPKAHKAGVV